MKPQLFWKITHRNVFLQTKTKHRKVSFNKN